MVEDAHVKTVALLGGVSLERGVPDEQVREYIRDSANLVWMDVKDPGPEEMSMLLEDFGFHPLALEDVAKGEQRPKVDEYKGYIFMVTYAVLPESIATGIQLVEIDLFIGRNYLVSIHRGAVPSVEEAYQRWTRGGPMLKEGVGFLVYTLMDAIIDAYFPLLDRVADDLDDAEDGLFRGQRERDVAELLEIKRNLFRLRRVLFPLREAFHALVRRDQPLFSPSTLVYFQDVFDHILRILDVVEVQRDTVGSALDAFLTVTSNRLNETMRRLTLVSVVAGFSGAVFGAWGMNINYLPAANREYGFFVVVGLTVALVLVVLMIARRRSWL